MRRFPALVVAASVLAALTACAPGLAGNGCESTVTSGSASATVDAPGDFGSAPEVRFPTPLITTTIERTELIAGDGERLKPGQPVFLEATILNGTDATVLQQTAYAPEGGSLFTIGDTALPALGTGLECTTEGSRVAIVASAEDSAASDSPPATSDSVVFVVDVVRAFPARANGTVQLAVAGMPSVVTAPDGTPGITIPSEPAPTEARESLLRLGDGDEIVAGDQVVAKLTAVDWEGESVVQSTWETGSAAIVDLAGDSVSEGLKEAITGKTVGSQVLAIVPPAAGADGATLIYVIDILGTVN
ncbi:FKBP-type peptidyl-prolyl cis-trans isomerase [Marisediminicola antarctica]|uniref:FKBP-type peptidyl-prolyl cis-trans isomerase n=1 Tax=Marisediminicola antarctica TaxID=674079 RepID=UPI00137B6DEE|nr:FKBP-type peptidyl-prolyl cis-trans isomerase [Marisediminicola antarctica]